MVKEVTGRRHLKGHSHQPCDGENSRVTGVFKSGRSILSLSDLLTTVLDLAFNQREQRLHFRGVLAGVLDFKTILTPLLAEHHSPISSTRHYAHTVHANDVSAQVKNPQKDAEVHDFWIHKNAAGRVVWKFKTKYDLEHDLN